MNLSNENTFEWTVVFCTFLGIALSTIAVYVLKRKGVDVGSKKVIFGCSMIVIFIGFLPFWFNANLSWQFKVIVPLVSAVIGCLYGLGIIRLNKKLHKLQ